MPVVCGKHVGNIGFGLMGLTWRPNPVPQEQAFQAMKAAMKAGATCWDGADFYGTPEYNTLHLMNRYFSEHPDEADQVVLSIKGALRSDLVPDCSPDGIRKSIENSLKVLDGKKTVDIFKCGRVDPKVPIEDSVRAMAEFVKAGKIGGIGLSEVRAETIRRAHKIHPIAAVEIELSLWATDPLTNGIVDTCAELKIPIVAYSPIGHGFLSGQIKSIDDIPADDFRRHSPRFAPDHFADNLQLVHELEKLAHAKGCTPAQLAISWVCSLSETDGRGVIIPIPGTTTEKRVVENCKEVALTPKELADIQHILSKAVVLGDRYGGAVAAYCNG
ncbi:MAG: Pyridoxine 4-dehydrogenase [Phylliscum demangeonii]|nr:MAG: Pyridoxine 4-dehydrogenase [Phylliscum demangeonii]